jgi:hypothetical protein
MDYATRQAFYVQVEQERNSKVIAFVTSDRRGMETQVSDDCIGLFVELLDKIGPTEKISLILHTNGGQTLGAWRIVNLIRTFCEDFEVIVPMKALSAGTLICIGSDRVVMTKQAALGPIDPSVNTPLNPQISDGGIMRHVPVSVEAVRGYLDAARKELKIGGASQLATVLVNLTSHLHPLVIGEIFRSRAQIRFLADKLIQRQISDPKRKKKLIDFLCADSGSHDYTINRREAADLGLSVEKPSAAFYQVLRDIYQSYATEMKILAPYSPAAVVGQTPPNTPVQYTEVRGLIETTAGGCYGFVTEGNLTKLVMATPAGPQEGLRDDRVFEGWRKLA